MRVYGNMVDFIKRNKLTILLSLVILILLLRTGAFPSLRQSPMMYPNETVSDYGSDSALPVAGGAGLAKSVAPIMPPVADFAPQTETTNRLVIEESQLSLQVKDVNDTRKKIVDFANQNGGYMVSSQVSSPNEAPYGLVTVRVSSEKLQQALDYFRSLSIKVVSESLIGTDVTDQYVDIEKHIEKLQNTITRFEAILGQAQEVSDITNLNQQIINLQSQIDSLKGQQEYLSKNALLTKITLHLSTDDIALPYAPTETFRPAVIFKLAVRSLVSHLRSLATLIIWLGVYAVVLVPLVIAGLWLKKRFFSTNSSKNYKN